MQQSPELKKRKEKRTCSGMSKEERKSDAKEEDVYQWSSGQCLQVKSANKF